jgi:hypothetical protein
MGQDPAAFLSSDPAHHLNTGPLNNLAHRFSTVTVNQMNQSIMLVVGIMHASSTHSCMYVSTCHWLPATLVPQKSTLT